MSPFILLIPENTNVEVVNIVMNNMEHYLPTYVVRDSEVNSK